VTKKSHIVLLGGFLGSGKTTAAACLTRYLADQGLRAGLITNDQGEALVDTAALQNCGWPVEEIARGCFCCRFGDLIDAAGRLSRAEPPDVLIAEAVGSCTDLAATVAYPLQQLHSDRYTVAPLSVLVDPIQAARMLNPEPDGTFSEDVRYLYYKQLEEADLIVINKCDLLDKATLAEVQGTLAAAFPAAQLLGVSSRNRNNLEPWFHRLVFGRQKPRPTMELDYGRYAYGEASLAWLNASMAVDAVAKFDPDTFLLTLANEIQRRLDVTDAEVAHLKLSLQATGELVRGTAVVNLARRDLKPECGWRLGREIDKGRLLLNLRAETAPKTLQDVLTASLAGVAAVADGPRITLERFECFRPSPPVPTHRIELNINSVDSTP
jgi:G3E family GTPase